MVSVGQNTFEKYFENTSENTFENTFLNEKVSYITQNASKILP